MGGEITQLLRDLNRGDPETVDRLLELLYKDLHEMAARHFARERPGHTLQPTALVHEAYLRLVDQHATKWQSRSHFLALAAVAMRRVLVDHARRHLAGRRGGALAPCIEFTDKMAVTLPCSDELLALDEALHRLQAFSPEQSRMVELRYFGGLSVDETAEVMEVSPMTIKRQWKSAKAWLEREISGRPKP